VAEARKPWWRRTKLWGTLLAATVRLYAPRFGYDVETAREAALLIMGGVGVEGLNDAISLLLSRVRTKPAAPEGKTT
jgi:hypothetical protein